MTAHESKLILTQLAVAYEPLSEMQMELYGRHFAPLDYKTTCAVVDHLIRTSKWFPKVADILSAYDNLTNPLLGAERAFSELCNLIVAYGWYNYDIAIAHAKELGDSALMSVIERMGWREICESDAAYFNNTFTKLYNKYAEQQQMIGHDSVRQLVDKRVDVV